MFDIMPTTLDELERALQSHKLEIGEYVLKKCPVGYMVVLNNGEEVPTGTLEDALLSLVFHVGEYTLREKIEQPFKRGQRVRIIGGENYVGKKGVVANFHGDICGEEDNVADNGGTDEVWVDLDPDGEFGTWVSPKDIEEE